MKKEEDFVMGLSIYMACLREKKRYSTAKSYQDALNSFLRFCGQEVIPYTRIDREMLLRYQDYLRDRECSWNTVSTYMRRIRRVYGLAMENGEAPYFLAWTTTPWNFHGSEKQTEEGVAYGILAFVDDRSVG